MSEWKDRLLPGQANEVYFTIEQVRCLSSVMRSEIFWAFSISKPMSIAEVAAFLDRPPNTTTYHVNELIKAGLLLAMGERKATKRIEKLYVKAARAFRFQDSYAPKEYRQLDVEGFHNLARSLAREMESLNEVFDFDPTLGDFKMIRRYSFKISRERAKLFKEAITTALREFAAFEDTDDADGVRINTVMYMAPTLAETRRRVKKHKKG